MGTLVVPPLDDEPWPTLGPQVVDFLLERGVMGPGSLQGEPFIVSPEFEAWLYRAHEVYPRIVTKAFAGGGPGLIVRGKHPWAGRRRFKRCGLSVRKGLAKTEKQAAIVYTELHPEAPVRCDGFDADGEPVGRPVKAPYIPMLAHTAEQVEELAFSALTYMVSEGPDADLFDVSLERIIRLDERGRADGKAVPLSNSPGSRDGARTTHNAYDEPHRLTTPRQKQAVATMEANLPKRPLEDPWSSYVGTAGELGEDSVAEDLHFEAEAIARGEIDEPKLFYLYRTDSGKHDLRDKAQRIEAIAEATGAEGEWGPGQFDDIASQWDKPKADLGYLERVWLNRWVKQGRQAFDVARWASDDLASTDLIPAGALVTVGFDGARFRDSTGFVVTDVNTGVQRLWAGWERPLDLAEDEPWEVPAAEVEQSFTDMMEHYDVWRFNGDPPYWITEVGTWAGRHPEVVREWWTNRPKPMAYAVRAYAEAVKTGAVLHEVGRDPEREEAFARHIAAAGRQNVNLWDDDGQRLFVLCKIHPDRKFDYAMCAVLSWTARLEALAAGATASEDDGMFIPTRIR